MGIGFDINSIESYEEVTEEVVYDLSIDGNENYFIDGDILVHNSSKTWDTFHFLYTFCDHNRGKGNDIYVLRNTLTNCRDYTFKDFTKFLKVVGGHYDIIGERSKPYINLFGNHIYFRGLDSGIDFEAYPSDILFFNEMLEMDKKSVLDLIMRCRKLVVGDWNPKFTKHWAFDLEKKSNSHFTRTTYKQNKHLEQSIIEGIESYEPYEKGSYEVTPDGIMMYKGEPITDKHEPPPNIHNIDQGTSDLFRWKVYGLGLRGAMKGLVFPYVKYIDKFPDIAHTYGNDFGFTTDPNSLVKYGQEGNNIYLELLSYTPMETEDVIVSYLEALGIEKLTPITADSSDKYVSEKRGVVEMVRGIRSAGYSCTKVSKTKSVMYWLLKMKTFKIHIVKNKFYNFAKTEQENYRMKEINGIEINQPEDSFNHFWDASRYAFMAYNTNTKIWG